MTAGQWGSGPPRGGRSRPARTALLAGAVLMVSACGGSEATTSRGASGPAAPPADSAATAPPPSPGATAPSTSLALGAGPGPSIDPDADNVFTIGFAEGKASGDTGRLKVGRGESVLIKVSSSRADEVHLHGYDLTAAVSVGRSTTLRFDAAIPGVFALELEDLGVELATLQVQ